MSELVKRILKGDRLAISKAISAIENREPDSTDILKALYRHTGRGFVIGITGPPGTGKSSLVDKLASVYRMKGKTVAILAVDPSSPVSGGAILGDRVRMLGHTLDPGIYIRSMASRGDEGGLSRAARSAVRILDASGYDVIIVETVGIGQAEVEIVQIADLVIVVLMPELGDEIQASKAGMMEIGDIFAVNKSDLPGADKVIYNLLGILGQRGHWRQSSVKVSAKSGQGIENLVSIIENYRSQYDTSDLAKGKRHAKLSDELIRSVASLLAENAESALKNNPKFDEIISKVVSRDLDPMTATESLLKIVSKKTKPERAHKKSR